MKKLLKRIWYRIRYKEVYNFRDRCSGCMNFGFPNEQTKDCVKFLKNYGLLNCEHKIFVKRDFKQFFMFLYAFLSLNLITIAFFISQQYVIMFVCFIAFLPISIYLSKRFKLSL